MWKLYYNDQQLTHLTVENLSGTYIEITNEEARRFYEAEIRFIDYMVVDKQLVLRTNNNISVVNMPDFIEDRCDGTSYEVMSLDASWLADDSIEETNRVIFKWTR